MSDEASPPPPPEPPPAFTVDDSILPGGNAVPAAPSAQPPAHRSVVRMAVGFYGVVTLFAIGYAMFSSSLSSLFGERSPTGKDWMWGVGFGLVLVVVCRFADAMSPAVERAGAALSALLGPVTMLQAVVLALASGFAEELLFRGALWRHLGLAGTSLLFGLVHTLPRRALVLYPVFAAVVGLLLGLVRSGTETVVPCMVAHAVVNGLNLTWLERRRRRAAGA